MNLPLSQLDGLSVLEKLQLVESLWDQIAESQDVLPVPEWQKEELDRRHERFEANPNSGIPWDEAKRRIHDQDVIAVYSVFHAAQDPAKWQRRLRSQG